MTRQPLARPIDRIASWLLRREAARRRPDTILECAECGRPVAPNEGAWFPQWRLAACSEECSFLIQSDHF